MNYSLEQMHKPKNGNERRNGKTVDALVTAIGSVMVTEKERIPFVIHYMKDISYIRNEFRMLCKQHFSVEPIFYKNDEWGIEGYTSRIFFKTLDQWERGNWKYSDINAVSDLHWSRIQD